MSVQTSTLATGFLADFRQGFAGQASGLGERLLEPIAANGFEDVTDCVGVKRVDGVLVVCCREDNRRRRVELIEMMCGLDSVHARHSNIEQHDVRPCLSGYCQRILPVTRIADDLMPASVIDQLFQAFARRGLIINDQDSHAAPSSQGNTSLTEYSFSAAETSTFAFDP